MRNLILVGAIGMLAGSLAAADLKDEVKNAVKKLADNNYSWKSTTDMGNTAGNFRPGPTEGKMAKDGTISLSMSRGDTTTEAFLKGTKGAIKTQDGWKSLTELADAAAGGGQQGRGGFMARMLQNYKAPSVEAESLVAKSKELKKAEDAIAGDLTDDGVKQLLTFGRRPGGAEPPAPKDAKGSVKFYLKDGQLAKYVVHVEGKITVGQNQDREFEINRTTTVELKDVGTTKVEVPDEIKGKLQ